MPKQGLNLSIGEGSTLNLMGTAIDAIEDHFP